MAYQALGLGSTANDGTGDDLRTGGDKINDNFVEIYTKIGTGSALTADTVALLTAAQTLTNKILTAPSINGVVGGTTTSQTITTLTAGSITGASGNFDINPATQILEIQGDGDASSSGVEGQIRLNCSNNNHGQTIKPQPHSAAVTNTMLLPDGANSTLVSEVATQTLTNKSLTSPTITGTGAIAGASLTATAHFQLPAYADASALSGIASPVAGMMVYQTDTNKAVVYNGTSWNDLY